MTITRLKKFVQSLDVKKKIAITIMLLVLVRIGSLIRLPFVNANYMKSILSGNNIGVLSILTGSSLTEMGFFALSISPYITASIIIQLLTVVFPSLESMAKDGKQGQEKYKKIIRYTGVGLAFIQALAMSVGFGRSGLLTPYNVLTVVCATATWTIGASILIAIGEFIESFGIGSGVSMLLFLNIISTVPNDVKAIFEMYIAGKNLPAAIVAAAIVLGITFAVLFTCTFLINAEKRIVLTTSRRVSTYGNAGNTSTLPIPFLTCSVMPVIFASSIMSIPLLVSRFVPAMQTGIIGGIVNACSQGQWFNGDFPLRTIGAVVYVALTFLFTYFYLSIQYNPAEIANNLKKQGTVIAGIRPGKPTADYLANITTKVALTGNACLVAMILATTFITNMSGISNMALGGTSAIIAVSVVHDVRKKLSAELVSNRAYAKSAKTLLGIRRAVSNG